MVTRTLAEVLADMAAVERKLTHVQRKADHYNAEVYGMKQAVTRLRAERTHIEMVTG